MGSRPAHYRKPPGRRGGNTGALARTRVLGADEIWSDSQRSLFREVIGVLTALDDLEERKNALFDDLGILFGRLVEAKLSRTRIATACGMAMSRVDALIEQGNTAKALREVKADGGARQ
jgi:hypothetical protein